MNRATRTPPHPKRVNDLWVMPEFETLLRESALDSMHALFADDSGERLSKPGLDPWRVRKRLTVENGQGRTTWYVKRYDRPPGRVTRAARRDGCGARSLAGVEWEWTRTLHALDIPCPRLVAMGEEFEDGRERRSVLITAEVSGDALERMLSAPGAPRPKAVVRRLAELVAALHGAGLVHRDLYLSHVFCKPHDRTGESLHLIDLQRVRRTTRRNTRWFVKDLAALNYSAPTDRVSRTTRVRFLLHYLGKRRLDREARCMLYRIVGKTGQIARHDRRRRRGRRVEVPAP